MAEVAVVCINVKRAQKPTLALVASDYFHRLGRYRDVIQVSCLRPLVPDTSVVYVGRLERKQVYWVDAAKIERQHEQVAVYALPFLDLAIPYLPQLLNADVVDSYLLLLNLVPPEWVVCGQLVVYSPVEHRAYVAQHDSLVVHARFAHVSLEAVKPCFVYTAEYRSAVILAHLPCRHPVEVCRSFAALCVGEPFDVVRKTRRFLLMRLARHKSCQLSLHLCEVGAGIVQQIRLHIVDDARQSSELRPVVRFFRRHRKTRERSQHVDTC